MELDSHTFDDDALFESQVELHTKILEQVASSANPPGYNATMLGMWEDGTLTTWLKLISNRVLVNRRLEVDQGGGSRAMIAAGYHDPTRHVADFRFHNFTWPRLRVASSHDPLYDVDTVHVMQADLKVDGRIDNPGVPLAGKVTFNTSDEGQSVQVTFPSGRFDKPPVVSVTPTRSQGRVDVLAGARDVTSSGFEVYGQRLVGSTFLTVEYHWTAVQHI